MWNMLPLIGCWHATQTKQCTCQVCFKAFMISCRHTNKTHWNARAENRMKADTTFPRFRTHPENLLLAEGAGGGEELLVAAFAVHLALLLHEAPVCQRGVAVSTVEFLGVPGHAHGHQERAPGESEVGGGFEESELNGNNVPSRSFPLYSRKWQSVYLMTLLHLLHIGVRFPAGMCSARCTTESRSCGCGCGMGRSGPLGEGWATLPSGGAGPVLGKPKKQTKHVFVNILSPSTDPLLGRKTTGAEQMRPVHLWVVTSTNGDNLMLLHCRAWVMRQMVFTEQPHPPPARNQFVPLRGENTFPESKETPGKIIPPLCSSQQLIEDAVSLNVLTANMLSGDQMGTVIVSLSKARRVRGQWGQTEKTPVEERYEEGCCVYTEGWVGGGSRGPISVMSLLSVKRCSGCRWPLHHTLDERNIQRVNQSSSLSSKTIWWSLKK